ncbi:hypothetical protein P9D57_01440 [Bacillus sonorensis]|uniref:hypothetical protein n=1 Tax=Bacillus sonorensis TaxID=119858 RepID=UPI002DB8B4E7|nr:hypothetical protein [Bacillus sonorensis]MEC1437434.1 hypothetical protein [Bacillus sonorensis]
MAKQSERQIGAFYYLYLNEFNEPPEPVLLKWIKFRNDVIHKGMIPNHEKTTQYAEYIFYYIIGILKKIRSFENIIKHELQYAIDYRIPDSFRDYELMGYRFGSMSVISMIGTSRGERDFSDKNFYDQLDKLKHRERWLFNT